MKTCVICDKELEGNRLSTKDKYELLNHAFICKECAEKIGITNMFSAGAYTAEKAKKKYFEMYPQSQYLYRDKENVDDNYVVETVRQNKRAEAIKYVMEMGAMGYNDANNYITNVMRNATKPNGTANELRGKYCTQCGAEISDGAKFCMQCGAPLSVAAVQQYSTPDVEKPKKRGCLGTFIKIIVGLIVFLIIIAQCGNQSAEEKRDANTAAEEFEDVFYLDLFYQTEDYVGKKIITTVPVSSINSDGDIRVDTETDYSDGNLELITKDKKLPKNFSNIKYITVSGVVEQDHLDKRIVNCKILYSGANAPEEYNAQMDRFEEQVILGKQLEREEFISSAEEVSYNDLRRNPDSYYDKALKLSVKITKVEVDGWVFYGKVWATYQGNEIVISDKRENREPRLMAGDSLTIYAKGDAMSSVTTYVKGSGILGSDIGAEVVDERAVVAVDMVYTEKEDVSKYDSECSNNHTAYQYYLKGLSRAG